jgi:hypothetical protein
MPLASEAEQETDFARLSLRQVNLPRKRSTFFGKSLHVYDQKLPSSQPRLISHIGLGDRRWVFVRWR